MVLDLKLEILDIFDGYVMEKGVAPCAIVVKDADNKFVLAYLYDIIKI